MRKSRTLVFSAAIALAAWSLGGCAQVPLGAAPNGAMSYTNAQVGQVQSVSFGTVLGVRPVLFRPNTTFVGTIGGGVVGNILGGDVGRGRGRQVARVLGTILGAAVGSAAESNAQTRSGEQVTARMDNGQVISVTEVGPTPIYAGQRIEVIGGAYGQPAHIVPIVQR